MSGLYLELITFIVVVGLGQFSPGPDMILLMKVSLSNGAKAGYFTALGIVTGLMIHAGIAIFFVDKITALSGSVVQVGVYILGASYLIWLGYQLLQAAFVGYSSGLKIELEDSKIGKITNYLQFYKRGFLCNLLNPKVAIFLAGVMLPFKQEDPSVTWSMLLWITVVFEGLLLWCVYVKFLQAGWIRAKYTKNSYIIDGVFGVVLLTIAFFLIREVVN